MNYDLHPIFDCPRVNITDRHFQLWMRICVLLVERKLIAAIKELRTELQPHGLRICKEVCEDIRSRMNVPTGCGNTITAEDLIANYDWFLGRLAEADTAYKDTVLADELARDLRIAADSDPSGRALLAAEAVTRYHNAVARL